MRLLHLYGDIMNLYGEYANVSALARYLKQQGVTPVIDRKTLYEEIDFEGYTFIYMGSGTEKAQQLVLKDLLSRKEGLKKACDGGTMVLATGNAFECFGKSITQPDGTVMPALGFFDFTTKVYDQNRITTDQVSVDVTNGLMTVGFINKASECFGITSPMFKVVHGVGNHADDPGEGIVSGCFYGTHLTGPLLIKNPELAAVFTGMLCEKAGVPFKGLDCEFETKGHDKTVQELTSRTW